MEERKMNRKTREEDRAELRGANLAKNGHHLLNRAEKFPQSARS